MSAADARRSIEGLPEYGAPYLHTEIVIVLMLRYKPSLRLRFYQAVACSCRLSFRMHVICNSDGKSCVTTQLLA